MKMKLLVFTLGMIVLVSACNNSADSAAKETDSSTTAVTTEPAVAVAPVDSTPVTAEAVPAPIDSAAVTKAFLAAQKKTKKSSPGASKKQGKNEVVVYNEATIPSHEALEQPAPKPATAAAPAAERVVHTKEYVYFLPTENASFPGGQAALTSYIKKNMVYPEDALRFHVEGTVYAEVTVDSVGYVKNVEFPAKHLGSGLEQSTYTVLMASPRWLPAKENGKRVSSKITVPVVYRIKH